MFPTNNSMNNHTYVISILSLSIFLIASCTNPNTNKISSTIPIKEKTFCFYDSSDFKIIKIENDIKQHDYVITKGNYTVFVYKKIDETVAYGEPDVRYYETIIFKIDKKVETFDMKNDNLISADCIYILAAIAKWPIAKVIKVKNGSIKGEKLSTNKWNIQINIDTYYNYRGYTPSESSNPIEISQAISSCL